MQEVREALKGHTILKGKLKYLKKNYPCLAIFVLKGMGMDAEITKYMQECKTYERDFRRYSIYIHGYWLPWLEMQRVAGKIKKGKYLDC